MYLLLTTYVLTLLTQFRNDFTLIIKIKTTFQRANKEQKVAFLLFIYL